MVRASESDEHVGFRRRAVWHIDRKYAHFRGIAAGPLLALSRDEPIHSSASALPLRLS
jgi:hypothetical protein